MSRMGIFSGTFDPVHMGHVAFAIEAMEHLKLSEVVFLPELSPRLKSPTPIHHRLRMLEQSLAAHSGLSVMVLKSPRFSVAETLPELQRLYKGEDLTLLLGSDIVRTFSHRWPGLEELFRSVALAIGLRGEDSKEEMKTLLEDSARDMKVDVKFYVLPSPRAALASTQVRQGARTIKDIHPDVAEYITQHGLYLS